MEHLWLDFMDHMNFLIEEGFVTPEETRPAALAEDGVWASKLRIDSPLLVAQSLRDNLMPEQYPAHTDQIPAVNPLGKIIKQAPEGSVFRCLLDIFQSAQPFLDPF